MKQTRKFFTLTPPAIFLLAEILIGSLLSFYAFWTFANLTDRILGEEKMVIDSLITNFFYSLRSPAMTKLMVLLSFLGGRFLIISSIVIFIFLFIRKHQKEAILFNAIVIMGAIINSLLKLMLRRERPSFLPLAIESDYSFPSSHSMGSFVFYMTLAYFMYHFTQNRRLGFLSMILASLLIFLIGCSRIYLGVHYPTDVLGGYIAGMLWFISIVVIDRTIILFRLYKQFTSSSH